jgi:hypothetical protein
MVVFKETANISVVLQNLICARTPPPAFLFPYLTMSMTSLTAEPTSATTYPLSWEAAIYHRIFSCQAFLFKKEIFFSHSPQKRLASSAERRL